MSPRGKGRTWTGGGGGGCRDDDEGFDDGYFRRRPKSFCAENRRFAAAASGGGGPGIREVLYIMIKFILYLCLDVIRKYSYVL